MKPIKIVQIGVNLHSHSNEIFGSLLKQDDIYDVVGCVFPENEKQRIPYKTEALAAVREMSMEEVLNDPTIEAVAIETDEIYLTKYALMAAKAGKHIHMEKPGGIDAADFEELIRTMRQTGKVLHLGYMYRYNPAVKTLLDDIKSGALGEIISVEAQMNCIHPKEIRQWLDAFPGGMMFYLGCHLVDLVLQIKGQPEKIVAYNTSSGMDGVTAQDFGMAVFEYRDGVSFVKTTACEIGGYARRQLVVNGTKGTVELKPFEMYVGDGMLYTGKTEYRSNAWGDMGEFSRSAPFDRYDDMMRSFAEYVRGERTNPYTLDYELALHQTVLKACAGK